MQLKKAIAAGALGALMAGSTLAFAASLSDFPAPFVSGGVSNFLMVVGANAAPSDVVGAIDVAARLGGAPVTSETKTCAGTSGAVTVTNGVRLDTANTKIRLGDQLTGAKDTLTSTDLPTVLPSGTVTDTSGNEYKYDQYIALGSVPRVGFSNPTATPTTPNVVLDAGGSASTNIWYTEKVIFQKPLAGDRKTIGGTDTTIDGKPITLFGQEYTLGSGDTELTNQTVTLYGGGTEVGLDWTGSPITQSVTVGGKTVSISLNGISTSNEGDMTIDGTSYLQTAGTYITTSSGIRIYVKSAIRYGQGGTGRVVLKVGADKVKLQNGQTVKTGSTDETVQGTAVTITGGGTGNRISISSIEIAVYPANSDKQKIIAGTDFTDPVFKSFKMAVSGVSPALDATTRSPTTVTYSGDNYVQMTFTDFRGTTKAMTIGNASTAAQGITMTDGTYTIHVAENDTISRNEYTIINQGGFSHLLQFTTNGITDTSPSLTLRDVVTNVDYKVYLNSTYSGTTIIDGKTYYVKNTTATGEIIQMFRGSAVRTGATAALALGLFTPLKLKNGEELALTKPTTLINNTYYSVPGNNTVTGGEGWYTFMYNDTTLAQTFNAGTVPMSITSGDVLAPTGANLTGATNAIGVVIIEEKDAANVRNSIVIPVSQGATVPMRISIDSATLTGKVTSPSDSSGVSTSDTYTTKGLDVYGALVTRTGTSGTGQYALTVSYPDDQVVADVMLGGLDMAVSTSVATAGVSYTTQTVSPIKTMVGKLDTEVLATDKTTKNIISIGGPCVNKITAELLGKTFPACRAASGLTANTALIKLVENAFGGSKVAMVVAGWEASNTRAATSALQTYETAGLTGTEKVM